MSALPPSVVLETAMFAMFTPASPNIVPTLPITPGTSSYERNAMSRSELDVDREAERTREEEAMLGPDRRPGDLDLLPTRADDDTHEVRVVLRRREALLGDLDAALGRDQRSVHLVHRFVDAALERAVQRGDGEEPRVVLGERAVHGDGDARRPRARERHREPRQLRRQGDERAEHLELARVDHGDVHRRSDDLAGERRRDLLGDDDAGPILRLGRRSCQVRRDHHLRELEQRPGVRLRLEDVERGARHFPRANCVARAHPRRLARPAQR